MAVFRFRLRAWCLLSFSFVSLTAVAADECLVKSQSAAVVIMVCKAQATKEKLSTEGALACKDHFSCNAWMWDDETLAPKKAPETDGELPKSATGAARAVWINDAKQLMEIRRAR